MGIDAVVVGSVLCVVAATGIVVYLCFKAVKLINEAQSND